MRKIALHLWPVMPDKAEQMLAQLGVPFDLEDIPEAGLLVSEIGAFGRLRPGASVAAASNLFPRIEAEEGGVEKEDTENKVKGESAKAVSLAEKKAADNVLQPGKIEFADFQKLDLRIGRVITCEQHPNADKLLRVMVDIGEDAPRQILAGMAEFYKPEEMIGRQVTVVANLAPRKIRGLESQGMILAAHKDGGLELVTLAGDVPPGSKVS
jgi:methionyl-tRNA synthetase